MNIPFFISSQFTVCLYPSDPINLYLKQEGQFSPVKLINSSKGTPFLIPSSVLICSSLISEKINEISKLFPIIIISFCFTSTLFALTNIVEIEPIIITDMAMPEKNGVDTIIELRQLTPPVGIIAMSGVGSSDKLLRLATAFDADMALKKPFTRDELVSAIKMVIKKVKRD